MQPQLVRGISGNHQVRFYSRLSATIPLGAVANSRHAPRRVCSRHMLLRLRRPCLTSLLQEPAVTLDCVFVSSLACLLVYPLPSTQFPQRLLSASSFCGSSIVVFQSKSFGRTSPRKRLLPRAMTDAKACRSSRIGAATFISSNFNKLLAIGCFFLSGRLFPLCPSITGHAIRRVLRQPQFSRTINQRQTSAATLGYRLTKPITLHTQPTNNRVSFTILISPLILNTFETWTLCASLGLLPRPH